MLNRFFAITYDMDSASFDIEQCICDGSLEEFCTYCAESFVENLAKLSESWKNVETGRNKAVFYDPETLKGITISAKNYSFGKK